MLVDGEMPAAMAEAMNITSAFWYYNDIIDIFSTGDVTWFSHEYSDIDI